MKANCVVRARPAGGGRPRIAPRLCLWAGALAALLPPGVFAEQLGVGVTAKIGTLGYGADLTIGLGPYLGIRGGYNTYAYEREVTRDEATVQGRLDWETIPLLLDVHPFGGGFRISGGPVINNNRIDVTADVNEPLKLEDTEYQIDDLSGSVTFDRTSYYLGLGYGNAAGKDGRWHFYCDFGVMYHGEPQLDAHATASDPVVQEALNVALQSEVDKARDDVKSYKYYPVIALGVSFAF
jgi:hypothetical protein